MRTLLIVRCSGTPWGCMAFLDGFRWSPLRFDHRLISGNPPGCEAQYCSPVGSKHIAVHRAELLTPLGIRNRGRQVARINVSAP
jgi:hypothetical protein